MRYTPEGEDFVIVNGDRKFNRALYGTNTGFRIETGDVPELGLYMPNMGGNVQLGVVRGDSSRWLNNAQRIKSIYRAGARIYEISDTFFGQLRITVLAMADAEGAVVRVEAVQLRDSTELLCLFGGASGERFSREGDLGVDPPDCFALKPKNCAGNIFSLSQNTFRLAYGRKNPKTLAGVFPEGSTLKLASPYAVASPLELWQSAVADSLPVLVARSKMTSGAPYYFALQNGAAPTLPLYGELHSCFEKAEAQRKKIASTVKIHTPDSYFNTLGGALSVAADGIWEPHSWLHGAVGWRMRLNGWRAAYVGDAVGWHDRARGHFDGYAASQVTNVEPVIPHPAQDTALRLARAAKVWGTQMYSNGYICRSPNQIGVMHHYDMNLCYIDELLWHFNWTGDMDYVRKMWSVLERHLAWEKRNFDADDDGLYDAYCCIWASDALQYNSGGATHSSAYSYRANKMAAEIAAKIGKNPKPYADEASKILTAMNSQLWLEDAGHWAEYKDFMGLKRVHPSAAIWSIYHAIDSETGSGFQNYQATRYVDEEIPHIPVRAKGLKDEGYATISTTNWLPYSWSINNVAFAEVHHMSLAYWQSGRYNEAFKLLKSSLLDGMYLGASPGNFGQISYYDAARGECYRDFGDPVGITARALVQGLFGVYPDAMNERWVLRPGFPDSWDYASLHTPSLHFDFRRSGRVEEYAVENVKHELTLLLKARAESIVSLTVNGKKAAWTLAENAAGYPLVKIVCPPADKQLVRVEWGSKPLAAPQYEAQVTAGDVWQLRTQNTLLAIYDSQKLLSGVRQGKNALSGTVQAKAGHRTLFVQLQQGQMKWWQPIDVRVVEKEAPKRYEFLLPAPNARYEMVNIDELFNASVAQIFRNKYLEPRSPYTTLQVPVQGIGEWCHPLTTADIDDSGLRKAAQDGVLTTPFGVPFRTPSAERARNVAFTTLWSSYPDRVELPLSGNASHAYLMMAGSTNHMQCRIANAVVRVTYADGSADSLLLVNPETWTPIEQDFYVDGYAFSLSAPRPYRVHLKSGLVSRDLEKDLSITGVYGRAIDGGAAIILDMPLDNKKQLKSLSLEPLSNEVVVGLMSVTVVR